MTNTKVTSAPLFGSSSPKQIRGIQKEIQAAGAEVRKSNEKRRALLKRIGALPDSESSTA